MRHIKLFDSRGKHILSLLKCCEDANCADLALPDGTVLFCAPGAQFDQIADDTELHFEVSDTDKEPTDGDSPDSR